MQEPAVAMDQSIVMPDAEPLEHGDHTVTPLVGRVGAAMTRRSIIAGLLIGLAWGVAMRFWMRFIAVRPEFSVGGTVFILAASVIVGTLLGLARWRRSSGGVGWWRLNVLSLGLLGVGGAVMWPSVMLGAVAMGLRRWPALRVALLVAAAGVQIPVLQDVIEENWRMSWVAATVAVVWYVPLIALEAWGFSVVVAPAAPHAPAVGPLRRVAFAAPVVFMVAMSVLVMGAG